MNETPRFALFPAAIVIGVESPLVLKPAPDTLIFEMSSVAVPSFVITTVSAVPDPTTTFPKSSDAGETVTATVPLPFPPPAAPLPVVPIHPEVIKIAASVRIPKALRTSADAEEWPESRDAGVATNRDVRASPITEAIVACDPVDALLAHGTQLGQVCTTGQWDRPALSASSAVGRAVKVRFWHRRRLLSGAD